jgi:large conductance mechanosensitive channel
VLQEFKRFLLRGNVIDLAIAVVIGAAFKAVVDAFVEFIVMPTIGIVGGEPSFDAYLLTVNGSEIRWGSFVTELVSFAIIAAALFVFVKSFERLQHLRHAVTDVPAEAPPLTVSEQLLVEIRDAVQAPGSPPAR